MKDFVVLVYDVDALECQETAAENRDLSTPPVRWHAFSFRKFLWLSLGPSTATYTRNID